MPVACVTGAGIRLGRAIALALGRAGFDVIVHANRSLKGANEVAAELATMGRKAWVEKADLADKHDVAALGHRIAKAHPALDVLVNNAAIYEQESFETLSEAQVEQMWAVNVHAPFFLTQALVASLRGSASPCIINITDMAVRTSYTLDARVSHYIAAKGALDALTRAWAVELAPTIRVNAVAPGPVAVAPQSEADKQALLDRVPLKREGSAEDIARAVVYLAVQAPYVTGQTIVVDGGRSIS